jgi:hypothetical protein
MGKFQRIIYYFLHQKITKFFPEIFRALKIYLTILIDTPTAERSKTWLRSVILNDRLSDLCVIKMLKDSNFELNFDNVVKDFNALAHT